MTHDEDREWLDIVDKNDVKTGVADRSTIHRKGHLHRSVHVFVLDSRERLYLQKRAMIKEEQPGKWDSSASGHVESNESYEDAAARELEEELGLIAALDELLKIPACRETSGIEKWWKEPEYVTKARHNGYI